MQIRIHSTENLWVVHFWILRRLLCITKMHKEALQLGLVKNTRASASLTERGHPNIALTTHWPHKPITFLAEVKQFFLASNKDFMEKYWDSREPKRAHNKSIKQKNKKQETQNMKFQWRKGPNYIISLSTPLISSTWHLRNASWAPLPQYEQILVYHPLIIPGAYHSLQ